MDAQRVSLFAWLVMATLPQLGVVIVVVTLVVVVVVVVIVVVAVVVVGLFVSITCCL